MSMMTLFRKPDAFNPNFFIPEELLKDPKYKEMSGNAKITFILIYDRFKNSKLKDEMGNVYCEFTLRELMGLLQRSESSVIRIKKNWSSTACSNKNMLLDCLVGCMWREGKNTLFYIFKTIYCFKNNNSRGCKTVCVMIP